MTVAMQLRLDGSEVEAGLVAIGSRMAPLTDAQADILRWIRLHGWISSTQAGLLVHAHGAPPRPWADGADGTPGIERWRASRRCYAASDGLSALVRLSRRGHVVRVEPGAWWLAEDAPDVPIESKRPGWRERAGHTRGWRAP